MHGSTYSYPGSCFVGSGLNYFIKPGPPNGYPMLERALTVAQCGPVILFQRSRLPAVKVWMPQNLRRYQRRARRADGYHSQLLNSVCHCSDRLSIYRLDPLHPRKYRVRFPAMALGETCRIPSCPNQGIRQPPGDMISGSQARMALANKTYGPD